MEQKISSVMAAVKSEKKSFRAAAVSQPWDVDDFYLGYLDHADVWLAKDPYATRDQYEVHDPKLLRLVLDDFNVSAYRQFVVLSGPLGAGKSAMMKILKQMFVYNKRRSLVIKSSSDLVAMAKSGEDRYLKRFLRCNLCIDEFGLKDAAGKHYHDYVNIVDELVYRRYERHGRVTFFTTNLNQADFIKRFDQRTLDRILPRLSWHTVTGPNYRKPIS